MAVKPASTGFCSRFWPSLDHAANTTLKMRRGCANLLKQGANGLFATSGVVLGYHYFNCRKREVTFNDGMVAVVALATGVISILFRNKIVRYTRRIDDVLRAPGLSFDEVYAKQLIHRLDKKTLRAKFVERAKTVKGLEFLEFTEQFDFQLLAEMGGIPVKYCSFATYGLSLKVLGHANLGRAFPLRTTVWSRPIPQKMQEEAARQEAVFQKVFQISAKYPSRAYNLAEVFAACISRGEDATQSIGQAESQQAFYVRELDQA
jgi:hypothetical protein